MMNLGKRLVRSLEGADWVGITLARVTVGLEFASTGWGKVNHLATVTAFFTELGIPAPGLNAVMASFTELVCGALLLLGLGTRIAAAPLVIVMTVAIITAKRAELSGAVDLVALLEWGYIVILIGLVLRGGGPLSLDAILGRLGSGEIAGDRRNQSIDPA